ncbi:MAG: hypothetical protein RL491_774 [Bacteroidota bacterium]
MKLKDPIKNIEQIEAYHEGRMLPEEKIDFEVRLLVDAELSEENDLYQKIMTGFQDLKTDRVRTKLKLIDEELERCEGAKRATPFYLKKKWMVSAAAMITVIFAAIFYLQQPALDTVPLPAEEGLPVLMGSNDHQVRFDDAMQHFKNNEFEVALAEFTQLLTDQPMNDTLLYFIGISELYTEKYSNAIPHMKLVSDNKVSAFSQKANYYLAYCYYQNGSMDEAKHELNRICQINDHPLKTEAERFLQMLDAR